MIIVLKHLQNGSDILKTRGNFNGGVIIVVKALMIPVRL